MTRTPWLAPALAFLFLTGLVAPSVAGGPLDPPAPAGASNLLTLDAHGAVLAWQDLGSPTTTIQVQGVAPNADGFNLADPLGRLVGADQASSVAGLVSFADLLLLKGSYTLLGPSTVLARPDLSAFATGEATAFAKPSSEADPSLAALCAAAERQSWVKVAEPILLRGYGNATPICALLLGDKGCLMESQAPCAWAMAWAILATYCPTANATCLTGLLGSPIQADPCGNDPPPIQCNLPERILNAVDDLISTTDDVLADAEHYATCTLDNLLCYLQEYATTGCEPKDKACDAMHLVVSLALEILGDGGGGDTQSVGACGPDAPTEATLRFSDVSVVALFPGPPGASFSGLPCKSNALPLEEAVSLQASVSQYFSVGEGAGDDTVVCPSSDATNVLAVGSDVSCEMTFEVNIIHTIFMLYGGSDQDATRRTTGSNHNYLSPYDGASYDNIQWWDDFQDGYGGIRSQPYHPEWHPGSVGPVCEEFRDSGRPWRAGYMYGALSQDNSDAPGNWDFNCKTGPANGFWGAGVKFKTFP